MTVACAMQHYAHCGMGRSRCASHAAAAAAKKHVIIMLPITICAHVLPLHVIPSRL